MYYDIMTSKLKGWVAVQSWAAQPGVWGGGQCPPHFWDQWGTGGGPMKMIFASTADSFYS